MIGQHKAPQVHFCSLLLAMGIVVVLIGCRRDTPSPTPQTETSQETIENRHDWDWVFIYLLPYDNNLEVAAEPVLDGLAAGVTSERVGVVALVDTQDAGGVNRHVITADGRQAGVTLATESLADLGALEVELDWVTNNFDSAKYAIVILGHGGRLDEMSYDANPGPDGDSWMTPSTLGPLLSRWRDRLSGVLEVLFLQQCGKGSFETYYTFRNTARVLMSSQTLIGAPNDYYSELLQTVSEQPNLDGIELVWAIARAEAPDMFTSYTAVSAEALVELPEQMNALLEPLTTPYRPLTFPQDASFRTTLDVSPGETVRVELNALEAGRYLAEVDFPGTVVISLATDTGADGMLTESENNAALFADLQPGAHVFVFAADPSNDEGLLNFIVYPPFGLNASFEIDGETFFDALNWLETLHTDNGLDLTAFREFESWMSEELLVMHRISPDRLEFADNWRGVSLMAPNSARVIERYSYLDIYADTLLDELLDRYGVRGLSFQDKRGYR